jgi:hypothetical protein
MVATGGVSVPFWPMLKTVGFSPVGNCQHCAGEGHKNEEHLQSGERVIRCSYIVLCFTLCAEYFLARLTVETERNPEMLPDKLFVFTTWPTIYVCIYIIYEYTVGRTLL